jgi:exopolysaccharide biosynthesis polyprenyl glycosylphosphotransferase
MNNKKQIIIYLTGDLFSAIVSWTLIYSVFTGYSPLGVPVTDIRENLFIKGLIVFPCFWIILYFIAGFYHDVYRRSRLKELGKSLMITITGVTIVLMFLLSSDIVNDFSRNFFNYLPVFFYIHFLASYLPRVLTTSITISAISKGKISFNTIIIGSDSKAVAVYKEMNEQYRSVGNRFIGFVSINGNNKFPMARFLNHLGGLDQLTEIISSHGVKEVILALETCEHGKIERLILKLDRPGLVIKAIPGMHDILTGRVRIDTIIETPLIRISHELMPAWQKNLKLLLDIIISVTALFVTLPLSVMIMLWIKLSSKGPVFYSHERVGQNEKPFRIYKFRTMIDNAEKNGPELSSAHDYRVTKAGRFLRRTRLDELPNFINVLMGDMSVVGPRPERRYYIDQIVKVAPHYSYLLKIKPGITSWGQVKYGYAENIEQMIQRLRYDIIYLKNMSIFVDLQILILTIMIVVKRNPHHQSLNNLDVLSNGSPLSLKKETLTGVEH